MTDPKGAEALAADAATAAELRALATDPNVVALSVETIRTQVDRAAWVGIGLGLAFTMVNVQAFAAGDAAPWTLPWLAAWLLDPMVSLILIALLRTEQVCARWHVRPGSWVRFGRWFALAATYAMNTWTAWFPNAHGVVPSQVLLHSVPPLLVFFAAEAITDAREGLTSAVLAAERGLTPATTAAPAADDVAGAQPERVADLLRATVSEPSPLVSGLFRDAPETGGDDPEPEAVTAPVAVPARPRRRRVVPAVPAGVRARSTRPARPEKPTDTREDTAQPQPPVDSGHKKRDARAWYMYLRQTGLEPEKVTATVVNQRINSDSYVKKGDITAWAAEYEMQTRVNELVGATP